MRYKFSDEKIGNFFMSCKYKGPEIPASVKLVLYYYKEILEKFWPLKQLKVICI